MAHSNRHWPSMFKSKPCTTHHQWQHDLNHSLVPNSCSKSPYSVGEERSPEPKPRWNPKPEQIRILEAIFNSGMVNPPRDEIRRIRAQLQEYGQVGDANVFYWFQNRKSRSKHKNRNLQSAKLAQQARGTAPPPPPPLAQPAPTSSSSSSSDKSSPGEEKKVALGVSTLLDMSNSSGDLLPDPYVFQVQQAPVANGYCFSDFSGLFQLPESGGMEYTGLLHELMSQEVGRKEVEEKMKMSYHNFVTSMAVSASTSATPTASVAAPVLSDIQGPAASGCPAGTMAPAAGVSRSTVFINDVAFEVGPGPLNLREAFGDDAFLLHSSGQPVPTNEWGITLHPLQHGAFYYLV